MPPNLHLASEAHLSQLLTLVRGYHEFEGIEMSESARKSALEPLLGSNPFGRVWLIRYSGNVVGYIALCFGYSIEFGGRDAFIDEFYIEEAYRGRGIGSQVLEHVIQEANKLNIKGVHLEVARSNTAAQALYKRAGFTKRDRFFIMSIDF